MGDIQQRKKQHIDLALKDESQGYGDAWGGWELPYMSLPELDLNKVDTRVELLGKKLNQPLIIASMTGGSDHAETINSNLAQAAEKMKVAMGVGSQRVALEKDEAKKTFEMVRKLAPTTVIFANMGAVQLNYGHGIESYERVVDMIKADALYLHINPMQEALQPEGDTNWEGILDKIEKLVKQIPVPVWVKEVGGGLDQRMIEKLVNIGIKGIDVAGVGGTSWTWIEGMRRNNPRLTEWFKDFGITTEESVNFAVKARGKNVVSIVASGGVRNPIQGLKSHLAGADYYSAARPFLEPAMESVEEVVNTLKDWEDGLRIAMFGIGAKNWKEAQKKGFSALPESNY